MYKIVYKENAIDEDIIENIDSLIIDICDINNMKYVDIINKEDINLLILYVRILKYYHSKPKLNERFIIQNNIKENKNIIKSILSCNWLINEDDVIYDLDKLENRASEFRSEINLLNESQTLKDKHKLYLMKYYLDMLKYVKKSYCTDNKRCHQLKKSIKSK